MDFSKEYTAKYQCPGCTLGGDTECGSFKRHLGHEGCDSHSAGTFMVGAGKLFLGLPRGFNRSGVYPDMKMVIYKETDPLTEVFDHYNQPVWKTKYQGDTIVRGLRPRKNEPFLVVIQGQSQFDTIDCIEITEEMREEMD